MAQAFFERLSQHKCVSADTRVGNKDGQTLRERAWESYGAKTVLEIVGQEGIDISVNVRNQLTAEMVEQADNVIVMAEMETLPDYLSKHKKGSVLGHPRHRVAAN